MNNIQTIVFLTLKDVGIEERGGGGTVSKLAPKTLTFN